MNNPNNSRTKPFTFLGLLALLLAAVLPARATIVGPYTPDANTAFLFHLDEPAGGFIATNAAGSLAAGTNAVAYSTTGVNTFPGAGVSAPTNLAALGASGASGFAFGGFGNSANLANVLNSATNGIGVDMNLNGGFSLDSTGTIAVTNDITGTHSMIIGANNAFTFEALINVTGTNGIQEIICSDNAGATAARGIQFRLNGPRMEVNIIGGTSGNFFGNIPATGPHAFVPNVWFHVALTHTETPVAGGTNSILYWTSLADTSAVANAVTTNTTARADSTDPLLLVIGNEARSAGSSLGSGEGLQGLVDEVRISKVARAATNMMFVNLLTITTNPASAIVVPGATANLTVAATSDFGPLSYRWRSNGVPLVNGGSFSGVTTPTLQISPALAVHAGIPFDCVITNSRPAGVPFAGGPDFTNSSSATLTIYTPKSVKWAGVGTDWDLTSPNWTNTALTIFTNTDNVTFDDVGSAITSIALNQVVTPSSVTEAGSTSYTISGSGSIAGSGPLSKSGSGILILNTTNSYTGPTTVSAGTLQLGDGSSTGSIGSGAVTNNAAIDARPAAANITAIAGNIAGTGTITVNGTSDGTLALTGSNSYSGLTTVSSAILQANNANALGTAAAGTTVASGGQLYINANVDIASEALTLDGTGPLTDGALRKGGAGATTLGGSVTLASDSTINVDGSSTLTVNSGISGSTFALTKIGGGALTLNANSTLTGGVTLSAGTLNINAAQALGQTPGAFTISGGSIDNTSGAPLTLTQNQSINWNGDLTFGGTTNLDLGTGAVTMNATHGARLNGAMLTIGGNITGGFNLTVEGAGILSLTGSNDFSGLFLDAGTQEPATVRISNPDAAGRGNIEYNGGGNSTSGRLELLGGITVTNKIRLSGRNVDATAIESLSGNNTLSGTLSIFSGGGNYFIQSDAGTLTFNGATGDGIAMTLESGTRYFTVRGAGDTVVSGIITNGAGVAGGLIKYGTGKLTLSAANSYTGATTVSNGTLLVNGSIASAVVTNAGGTLGGTGTITGPVIIQSAGTLAPGASIGTLTINGDLTLGGNVAVELNKSVSPTNDLCVVSGVLTNAGTGLVIVSNQGPALVAGNSFTLFSQPVLNGSALTITPAPGAGLAWTNKLESNGSIEVILTGPSYATNATNLTFTASGGSLTLSWPADHLGWILQSQTNSRAIGLTSGWIDMAGTASVTATNLPVSATEPTVFFRLRIP